MRKRSGKKTAQKHGSHNSSQQEIIQPKTRSDTAFRMFPQKTKRRSQGNSAKDNEKRKHKHGIGQEKSGQTPGTRSGSGGNNPVKQKRKRQSFDEQNAGNRDKSQKEKTGEKNRCWKKKLRKEPVKKTALQSGIKMLQNKRKAIFGDQTGTERPDDRTENREKAANQNPAKSG